MRLNSKSSTEREQKVKLSLREKKHQANLRKSGGLYFQIGLVATLFIFFGVFQMKFHKKEVVVNTIKITDTVEHITNIPDFIIEEDMPKSSVKTEEQPYTNWTDPKIVDDTAPDIETVIDDEPIVLDKAPSVSDIHVDDSGDDPAIDTFPVSLVSELPIYPGCESYVDQKEQLECFSSKVAKLVSRKFNTDVASDNGITGKQKILVTFIINTKGEVVDVKARAPHPELQKEAIKAVNTLPKMTPAKQGFKTVNVTYSLPIIFEVQ
ncbi:MAG: energy transducer TonB [Flavobacteriaceae bacterium]